MSADAIEKLVTRFATRIADAPSEKPFLERLREAVGEAAEERATADFFALESEAARAFATEDLDALKSRLSAALTEARAEFAIMVGKAASPVVPVSELRAVVDVAVVAHQHVFDRLLTTVHGWARA